MWAGQDKERAETDMCRVCVCLCGWNTGGEREGGEGGEEDTLPPPLFDDHHNVSYSPPLSSASHLLFAAR